MKHNPKKQQSVKDTVRQSVLRQLHATGMIRQLESDRKISDTPFYSSVAGRKNRKLLVIQ